MRILGSVITRCYPPNCLSGHPCHKPTLQKILTQHRAVSTTSRQFRLPQTPARTRFAPSPTGNLHLGSIRTALYNFLLARRTSGKFLLRIEDTDQKRTIPGAEDRLYRDLGLAGLQWDEGPLVGGSYGPYRQSERTELYHLHAKTLLASEKAYRCFCSSARIDELNRSRHDKGLPLGYDRKCAELSVAESDDRAYQGISHTIRFRVPQEYPKYLDLVYGKSGHGSESLRNRLVDEPVFDDPVLIKSDGFPTYHFANVVDDKLMQITHVVRGSEWMSSTPLHVALYEAFSWSPPAFAHVPLLVDRNRQKLSKRNFDSDIASFQQQGIFPEALVNFAALLGWSHQQPSDVMNLKELQQVFDLKFTKGNTIVSLDKLRFLQERHARRYIAEEGEEFEQMIRDVAVSMLDTFGAEQVMNFLQKRDLRTVIAILLKAESLPFESPKAFVDKCAIFLTSPTARPAYEVSDTSMLSGLRIAAATLCLVPEKQWTSETHRTNLQNLQFPPEMDNDAKASAKKWKKELFHYIRWALLNNAPGPSIPETMEILGRDICTARFQSAAIETKSQELMSSKASIEVHEAKL